MNTRSSLSEEQREQLVGLFEQDLGFTAAARRIGVRRAPVRSLYHRWLLHGRLCLVEKPTKKHYSFEIKKEVVDRFLAGETRMDLAKEFKLSSPQQVKDWVSTWRKGGDEALRPKPKGRPKGSARPVLLTEEDRLRRENEKLRAENAYLKKLRDLKNQRRG
ncbi:transposase-like protein [Corynebacterium diphtheriae HC01]|nr:transposase-like protein [Corynebacterium diphtheriae 241]AEX73389.1 transposase-like protein [Corynebacterium diphtheriae HC01]